jgi:hypothetical protein
MKFQGKCTKKKRELFGQSYEARGKEERVNTVIFKDIQESTTMKFKYMYNLMDELPL